MKKLVLIVITFFISITNTFALNKVDSINTDINIDKDGSATISSQYKVLSNDTKYLELLIPEDIENIKVVNGKKNIKYDYETNKIKIKLTNNEFIIKYKISNFIYNFKDSDGINYTILSDDKNFIVKTLNVSIKTYVALSEQNIGLKVIGNESSITFNKNNLELTSSNIDTSSKIKILATLDIDYQNKKTLNKTFNEVYQDEMNKAKIKKNNIKSIENYILKILIVIVILIIIGIVIYIIISKKKRIDEYIGIIGNKEVSLLKEVDYNDNIPCNGDLNKIAFISHFYQICNNRSNLIGAYILKWWYEDKLNIIEKDDKLIIYLYDDIGFSNSIEADLYDILKSSSNKNILEKDRLDNYCKENAVRIIAWYDMSVKESIKSLYQQGYIKRIVKHHKVRLILKDEVRILANEIQGLKKYILHFNQVPRKTELTEQGYKYLLIIAMCLGVGSSFADEILRKNKDNEMALKLNILEKNRKLYKDVYKIAYDNFNEANKIKKIDRSFDIE